MIVLSVTENRPGTSTFELPVPLGLGVVDVMVEVCVNDSKDERE